MPALKSNELADLSGLLQLSSLLLSEELNHESLALLDEDAIRSVLIGLEPEVEPFLNQEWNSEALEEAAVEYCHLFVLPKGISPMASAWTSKDEAENISLHIQTVSSTLRSSVEFDLPPKLAALPPEHAASLLSTAAGLASSRELEIQSQAIPFLETTTIPWLGKFSEKLSQNSTSTFYRAVGRLIHLTYSEYITPSVASPQTT